MSPLGKVDIAPCSVKTEAEGGISDIKEQALPLSKRLFDILVAGGGLLVSLPLAILIAAAVKLYDGGPVFFRDQRVGQGGRMFSVWKFRSMIIDGDVVFGPRQAQVNDSRVTRVGRILRATALDELPQLWNIFIGDMSFVGPRALRPGEILTNQRHIVTRIEDIQGYWRRHSVPPGLTGVAQIYADRDVSPRNKFRYDFVYLRRRTFWLDIRLILLSFWITARGRWERRGKKW
jgi:lipopolysaccharide/colanic/teichoic acid biosynthesis glycosyltransferase